MPHPLLQIRKAHSPRGMAMERAGGVRQPGAPCTVGEQLRLRLGENFDSAFVAGQLGCSEEAAESLQEFWLPLGPRPLREQTLLVFARTLNLDFETLRALLGCDADVPARDRGVAAPARRPDDAAWPAPDRREPQHAGFAESAGPTTRRAPTVIWRKRHSASPP
jgi:hypothetical protein